MSMAITAACHDPRIWTVLDAKHRSQSLAQYLPYPSVFRLMQKRASRIKRGKKLVQLIHSKHSRKLVLCVQTRCQDRGQWAQLKMPLPQRLYKRQCRPWKTLGPLEHISDWKQCCRLGGARKLTFIWLGKSWKHDGALIWLGQIVQSSARPWEDLSRFQDRSKMPRERSDEKSLCWSQSCPLLKQE